MVRNSSVFVCSSNDRDAKSAILFSIPGTCCVVRGEDWHASMRSASVRRSLAAVGAFVDNRRDAHATVGVLSHQHATCVWARSANCSRTSHWSRSPAISRSEFVIFPCGFARDTISFWISIGKGTRQTIGGSALFKPNHTPPAPCLEASQ